MHSVPTLDAFLLCALFAAFGLWQMAGPDPLRQTYRRWHFPQNTHRVAGSLAMIAALFLAYPITRIWGVALGGFLAFLAVVTLLNHGKYALSIPGMVVLVALVPASLAGPFA